MDLVLIPAYEPDSVLITLTADLKASGLDVLVVDDGSGEKYRDIFDAVKKNATVITLEKNCGKGAALKAGMRYIKESIPECENFITCDADGQHRVEDVLRVQKLLNKGEKFVLTMRNRKKDVPLRSKVGNAMSRWVYALLTNRYLSDNQSGLRGFKREHLDWMIEVEKNNYDYEMNVLYYAAKKNIKIATLPIDAIYIENNASSHFSPVADTIRIYKSLFARAGASFIAFFTSEVLILLATVFLGYQHLIVTVPTSAAIAYLVSVFLNIFIFFKNTKCYDFLSTLIYTVLTNVFYTCGCALFMLSIPQIPLWVAFNIIYFACIPLRYLLHKFIFIASRTVE